MMRLPDHILNHVDPRYLIDFEKTSSTLLLYGVSESEIERLFATPNFSIYTIVSGISRIKPTKKPEEYVWFYSRSLVELQLDDKETPVIWIDALPLKLYEQFHNLPTHEYPIRMKFDNHLVLTIYHDFKDINSLSGIVNAINHDPLFHVISYSAFPEDELVEGFPRLREIQVRVETEHLEEIPIYSTRLWEIIPNSCKRILWKDGLPLFYDSFFSQSFPETEAGLVVKKFKSIAQIESILMKNGFSNITIIDQDKGWLKMTFSCKYLYGKNLFEQMNREGISVKVYGDKNDKHFRREDSTRWTIVSTKRDYGIDDEASVMRGIAGGYGEYWGRD